MRTSIRRKYTYKNITASLSELCRLFPKVKYSTAYYRMSTGCTIEEAMEDPVQERPCHCTPEPAPKVPKETPGQRKHFIELRLQDIERKARARGMFREVIA